MTSRREFLQIGISATALPLGTRVSAAALGGSAQNVPLYAVICDTRFRESRSFGRRSEALGLSVHAIDGDMTKVWYDNIHPRWQESPVAIAGLTGHGAMFCFEQLAHDHRMRVVFRAEHRPRPGGFTVHEMTGPASMLSAAFDFGLGADSFGACMAEVAARCPNGRSAVTAASTSSPERLDLRGDETALWSWVIAPARPADA